jgi:signal transduction histidine kinase
MTFRMRIAVAVAVIILLGGGTVILISALSYQRGIFETPSDQSDAMLRRFGATRAEALAYIRAHPEAVLGDNSALPDIPGRPSVDEVFRDVQRSAQDDAIRRSRYWSALALVLTAGAAGTAGWLIAGRAVRPVKAITAKARLASELHLQGRVEYTGPADEIGDLADTFDSMLNRLDVAFQAQRNFSGQVAHELRTPLATIASETEFLRGGSDLDRDRAIDQIEAATRRADQLITALLVLARSGIGDLAQSDVELDEITGDVLGSVVNDRDWRDLRVDLVLDATPVRGDGALLRQAILNLLTNASRHNRPGGWVNVTTRIEDDWSVVSVVNSTVTPMVPATATVDRNGSSSVDAGIGLTIVEAVAVAHGGRMVWDTPATDEVCAEIWLPRRTTARQLTLH